MIFVDTYASAWSTKSSTNELAQKFFGVGWDQREFPYRATASVWDQRAQDNSASHEYGRDRTAQDDDPGSLRRKAAANIDARMQVRH